MNKKRNILKMSMDKNDTYKLKVSCKNCHQKNDIDIERGIRAEEDTLHRVMIDHKGIECPNCGCSELIKVF